MITERKKQLEAAIIELEKANDTLLDLMFEYDSRKRKILKSLQNINNTEEKELLEKELFNITIAYDTTSMLFGKKQRELIETKNEYYRLIPVYS